MDQIQSDRFRILRTALVAVLFAWIAGVVTLSQLQMAPTYDEQNHVTRGIAILRTGDYRLCFHHPPLANILEGLPVAWHPRTGFTTEMAAWRSLNIWDAARETIWLNSANGVEMIHQARLPVLLFTLVLAVVVFLWSRELFGPWGGIISLALFALDPNILAHSGLATTDVAAACTIVLGMYWFRRYVLSPSRPRLLLAGVGLGLALATKFTGLLLAPLMGIILLALAVWPSAVSSYLTEQWRPFAPLKRAGRVFSLCLVIALTAGILLWGVYGFHVEPLGQKPGQPLSANASLVERVPVPALQYLRGLRTVMSEADGHYAYLLGETDASGKGWWYYFPVAIAVKTPVPALLLIIGALVLLALPRARSWLTLSTGEKLFLLVPVGAYLVVASGVLGISLNLGIRHVLPMFPFLYILAGAWAKVPLKTVYYPIALLVVLALQSWSVLSAYPDYIAYFNEVSEAKHEGYEMLIDSNYDWGQDLARLAELQREDKLPTIALSYFGTTPPEAYGIDYIPISGFGQYRDAPKPDIDKVRGYVAISVTNLVGGPDYAGVDYRPLLNDMPYTRVGKTIYVYLLPSLKKAPSGWAF